LLVRLAYTQRFRIRTNAKSILPVAITAGPRPVGADPLILDARRDRLAGSSRAPLRSEILVAAPVATATPTA
jgi:hypothetical protein